MEKQRKRTPHVSSKSNSNYYQLRVKEASMVFDCPVCKHSALLIKGEVIVCEVCAYTPEA